MKPWKMIIILLTLFSLGALTGLFFLGKTKTPVAQNGTAEKGSIAGATTIKDDDYLFELAKASNDAGLILYCSFQSPECKEQKNMFKDAFTYINYVECDAAGPDANPDECLSQNVDSYPTWIYQGKKTTGLTSLANLAKIINFSK